MNVLGTEREAENEYILDLTLEIIPPVRIPHLVLPGLFRLIHPFLLEEVYEKVYPNVLVKCLILGIR